MQKPEEVLLRQGVQARVAARRQEGLMQGGVGEMLGEALVRVQAEEGAGWVRGMRLSMDGIMS